MGKFLNFIGLVDDEDTRDTYGEEYSSESYGRKAAYVPPRSQRSASARGTSARQPAQRRLLGRGERHDQHGAERVEHEELQKPPFFDQGGPVRLFLPEQGGFPRGETPEAAVAKACV